MRKGSKHSKEAIEKIRQARSNQVIKHSYETRRKIGLANKGNKYALGRKHTADSIKKMSGSNSVFWKGGITENNHYQRIRFRRTIQQEILKRDDFICQLCGIKGGTLHVDHIQPWADYVEGRFSIDNCRTVCRECHYQITFSKPMPINSTWGLYRNNSQDQLGIPQGGGQ